MKITMRIAMKIRMKITMKMLALGGVHYWIVTQMGVVQAKGPRALARLLG